MSYGVIAYRCDIGYSEGLFGTIKKSQINRILKTCQARLNEIDNTFCETVRTSDLLDDFVVGKINYPEYGYLYWYVFEQICACFGNCLPNKAWYPADITPLSELPSIKPYSFSNAFLPMPDDFPFVYKCEKSLFKSLMQEAELGIKDLAQCRDLERWIAFALAENQDLVFFYY